MRYKAKIQSIIEREGLNRGGRSRELVYKRIVLTKVLKSLNISYERIAAMFEVFTKSGYGDHASSINWHKRYDEYCDYQDFIDIENEYLAELKIRTREEEFDESLTKKVLLCNDYWQMKQLQEELKKDLH